MTFLKTLKTSDLILTEAAVCEALSRDSRVRLHPRLINALLVYDDTARRIMETLYQGFMEIAANAGVPILLCAPTWRANRERLDEAGCGQDVNADNARWLIDLKNRQNGHGRAIFTGGLVGCRNDCYRPDQALCAADARAFHQWQIDRLAACDLDFLMAATLPSIDEALGIARALQATRLPYLVSFVINRDGRVLDGSTIEQAIHRIDNACERPPAGYMVNCSYPSFLKAGALPEPVLKRLVGFQANASALDHSDLDGSSRTYAEDIDDWIAHMAALNRRHGIPIMGGCCGTTADHLLRLVQSCGKGM